MAFKMKYTNGRKASPSSFPFKNPGIVGGVTHPGDSPLEQWDWSSAGSGAAKGASAGAVLGPWGAAAGAVVGGVWGGIAGGKAKERAERAAREEAENQKRLKDEAITAERITKRADMMARINSARQQAQTQTQTQTQPQQA